MTAIFTLFAQAISSAFFSVFVDLLRSIFGLDA
jgi:hypothetical protein